MSGEKYLPKAFIHSFVRRWLLFPFVYLFLFISFMRGILLFCFVSGFWIISSPHETIFGLLFLCDGLSLQRHSLSVVLFCFSFFSFLVFKWHLYKQIHPPFLLFEQHLLLPIRFFCVFDEMYIYIRTSYISKPSHFIPFHLLFILININTAFFCFFSFPVFLSSSVLCYVSKREKWKWTNIITFTRSGNKFFCKWMF